VGLVGGGGVLGLLGVWGVGCLFVCIRYFGCRWGCVGLLVVGTWGGGWCWCFGVARKNRKFHRTMSLAREAKGIKGKELEYFLRPKEIYQRPRFVAKVSGGETRKKFKRGKKEEKNNDRKNQGLRSRRARSRWVKDWGHLEPILEHCSENQWKVA